MRRRLQELSAIATVIAIVGGFGVLLWVTAPAGDRLNQRMDARIISFRPAKSKSLMVPSLNVRLVLQLDNGRRLTEFVQAERVASCRRNDRVVLEGTRTNGDGMRWWVVAGGCVRP